MHFSRAFGGGESGETSFPLGYTLVGALAVLQVTSDGFGVVPLVCQDQLTRGG